MTDYKFHHGIPLPIPTASPAPGKLEELAAVIKTIREDEAAHPERTALERLLHSKTAYSPGCETAIRRLAEIILVAGYRKVT